jgi:hypothetical protein
MLTGELVNKRARIKLLLIRFLHLQAALLAFLINSLIH